MRRPTWHRRGLRRRAGRRSLADAPRACRAPIPRAAPWSEQAADPEATDPRDAGRRGADPDADPDADRRPSADAAEPRRPHPSTRTPPAAPPAAGRSCPATACSSPTPRAATSASFSSRARATTPTAARSPTTSSSAHPRAASCTPPSNTPYLALRPLLPDYVLAMPRGAQVIYPKDAAQIVTWGDVFPGARVLEAGAGSGALTLPPAARGRARKARSPPTRSGRTTSSTPSATSCASSASTPPNWTLHLADVVEASTRPPTPVRPRRPGHARALGRARRRCATCSSPAGSSSATSPPPRSSRRSPRRCASRPAGPSPRRGNRLIRPWHSVGLAVRPEHRMIAHTAFLVTARRLADGVVPPRQQRRPSRG